MFLWKEGNKNEFRDAKKIDAHVHLLSEEMCQLFQQCKSEWGQANVTEYIDFMNQYHIEKAVENGLVGLKIHPTNLNMNIDDLMFVPILRKAADLHIPVLIHSYPSRWGFYDNCSPARISKMIRIFPDLDVITAHLGGHQFLDAMAGCTYVDLSYVILEMVTMFGVAQTNRFLRQFGV